MSVDRILRRLLFALACIILVAFPVPYLFAEEYFEHEFSNYTALNLTQGISRKKFLVNPVKTTLIKNLSRPESTSKVPVIFLLNIFATAPHTTLSSTILLL